MPKPYVLDYPPGNPADVDTTARIFVDLAPIAGFRHEYAVTSIDTTTSVNSDFAESPIDSSQLVYLTPATPPADNLEHVAVVPNPYKGSAEALTDVMTARVDYYFSPVGLALPLWGVVHVVSQRRRRNRAAAGRL